MICVNEVAGEHILRLRVQQPRLALQVPVTHNSQVLQKGKSLDVERPQQMALNGYSGNDNMQHAIYFTGMPEKQEQLLC